MTLSIFERFIGSDRKALWPTDAEAQGELAVDVLDSVQTIVDVLVDRGQDYRVGFAADATASTDFTTKRIAITARPLKEGGRPLADILDILTGFAVHEVGHARLDDALTHRVGAEWPGKVSPARLSNTIQDVRLERNIIDRFPGLAGVFDPTMEWVAGLDPTARYLPVAYGTALDERLNFVAAIARYRQYITVASDPVSVAEDAWWSAWIAPITGQTTDDEIMAMLRIGLDHLRMDAVKAPPPEGQGTERGGKPPEGQPKGESQPAYGDPDDDLDDDDTEGGDTEGDDEGEGEGEGTGTGDEPDGDDAGTEGDSKGNGDGEGDDEPKDGSGDTEGDSKGSGDGDADSSVPDMAEGESLDRVDSDKPMGDGSGGSGKAITEGTNEDPDDVDAGLRPEKLAPTMDQVNEQGQDYSTQHHAEAMRNTERLDAGAFGQLKVRVRL